MESATFSTRTVPRALLSPDGLLAFVVPTRIPCVVVKVFRSTSLSRGFVLIFPTPRTLNLGGVLFMGGATGNLNNIKETGVYTIEGDTTILSGSTVFGALLVFKGSPTPTFHMGVLQVVFDTNGLGLFIRQQWMTDTWTDWGRIKID